jgi:hypothetical protein
MENGNVAAILSGDSKETPIIDKDSRSLAGRIAVSDARSLAMDARRL